MIIINDADFRFKDTCVTVGKFDTLHIGHKALMERMEEFRKKGLSAVVLRLEMPGQDMGSQRKDMGTVLLSDDPSGQQEPSPCPSPCTNDLVSKIRTEKERIELLEALGIDIYIRLPFTEQVAHMSAESFIKNILVDRLGVGAMVVGDDFRFGYERAGDTDLLKSEGEKYGFETVVLERIKYDGQTVSSSLIRELIREGKLDEAYKMLG
ncbi:MAG: hypothetical protein K6F16_06455 [Lachnospiraceae bacterium]|nr:hypothetical protein [Lachnospiraceae bacterium]